MPVTCLPKQFAHAGGHTDGHWLEFSTSAAPSRVEPIESVDGPSPHRSGTALVFPGRGPPAVREIIRCEPVSSAAASLLFQKLLISISALCPHKGRLEICSLVLSPPQQELFRRAVEQTAGGKTGL